MSRVVWLCALALLVVTAAPRVGFSDEPRPEHYLTHGKLIDGERALQARLDKSPEDDSLRFGLGAVQFLRALEGLGQNLYTYGLRDQTWFSMPILRLPFGKNPNPKQLTYQQAREIVQTWVSALEAAEKTLASIKDPNVALPLEVDQITLDIRGDTGQPVRLLEVLSTIGLAPPPTNPAVGKGLLIRFDRADVAWLRAYCHLLSALGDIVLAHDGHELFANTAHLFFKNVESPYAFLNPHKSGHPEVDDRSWVEITDLIALVHLVRLPVVEPARLQAALAHLEQMVSLSREMWKLALAETDNDHEWIPNPKQKGPFNVVITQEMVDGWMKFLDEAHALLSGSKLIPFWRDPTEGINLHRVFAEPKTFDLVLWVQGTAAAPYLERGPQTSTDTWNRFMNVFRGDFVRFFLWIN